MTNQHIIQIIRESAFLLGQSYDDATLNESSVTTRGYGMDEVAEFNRDLMEAGNKVRFVFLENSIPAEEFGMAMKQIGIPVLAFLRYDDHLQPIIMQQKGKRTEAYEIHSDHSNHYSNYKSEEHTPLLTNEKGEVIFLGIFSYKSLVSDDTEVEAVATPFTPVQRLVRLLSEERKDIINLFIYAIFIGLISLTLPLGIQATVELVSGGVVVSSVYILIAFVILGVLASGGLQVMQITIVEFLQRRIFTKAALEFAFRVPRIKVEFILKQYAPELMNRFFDVLTLQKGLPKLLIDLTSGIMQILFGLLLLSFYHPFFVFFGLVLLGVLVLIFYATGPKGLTTSIKESKYKYKVVYWLEELARTINSFKIAGNTLLPIKKTEYNVNNYLKNRRAHFRVLLSQYMFVILFKAVVTGGLLIIGTILVIQREITLGQFVASEVIIILILNSVEKLILYMEVIYDMLTAVDKIAHVTDLPIEKSGGIDIPRIPGNKGFALEIKDLSYKYPDSSQLTLKNVNLSISSGEKICIAGGSGSGKTTLTNTIAGLHYGYEGVITIDKFSLRDLDLTNLRDLIAKNVSLEDIFDGTIAENVLVGKPETTPELAIQCLTKAGIDETINRFPEGINTHIVSGGKGFSKTFINRLILARCFAKRPKLLILNDYFDTFQRSDKLDLIRILTEEKANYTLLVVSNDPVIMAACDQVVLMEEGTVKAAGPYEDLLKNQYFAQS